MSEPWARVKRARKLEIAIAAIGQPSGGTARSVVEMLPKGIRARIGGRIVPVPAMKGIKRVQFSQRDAEVMPAPLADLESAFHSTGVEDIRCYLAVPRAFGRAGRALWPLAALTFPIAQALLRNDGLRQRLGELAHGRNEGPNELQRQRGRSFIWARAEADGGSVESVLSTLEGYELTRLASVRIAERVLADKPVGARSPAQIVGKDFVLELPNTTREDR